MLRYFTVALCLMSLVSLTQEQRTKVNVNQNQEISDSEVISISGINQDSNLSTLEVAKRLQTSGLFSKIRVHRATDAMTITVDEKTSWFILPYASIESSSSVFGAAAGQASAIGDSGSLIERFQLGSGNQEANVIYRDEFFMKSLWITGASLDFENTLNPIYEDRVLIQETRNRYYGVSFLGGYHLTPFQALGVNTYIERHQFEQPDRTVQSGIQLSHKFVYDHGNFYVNEGLSTGQSLRYYFEIANPASAFQFQKTGLSGNIAVFSQNQSNWVVRPKVELGNDLPYYQRFELGGGRLRSFPAQSFRSDSYLEVQNDILLFSVPVWSLIVRPIAYLDWAHVKDEPRIGIGSGFNVYLKKVAMPAIQFSMGYGLNPNGVSGSFALGPQF